jgi:hypothetical protein
VRKGADKLKAALHQKQQGRLDGFFKAAPKAEGSSVNPAKRKVWDAFFPQGEWDLTDGSFWGNTE